MSDRLWSPHRPTASWLALIGAIVTAVILSGGAPAGAVAATRSPTYLAGGRVSSGAVVRPAHLVLSGDSTLWLTRAHWRFWRHRRAIGQTRSHWASCDPNCASGKIVVRPARVTLSRPRHRCGQWFFTRVTFHFTAGRPQGVPQNYRWNAAPTCD